jgi:hypothetical protein
MAKMKISNMLPVAIGIFLLVLVYGTGVGRSAQPDYDGRPNTFELTLSDQAARAEVGDTYWVDVDVENTGNRGSMWVQCSILDQHKESSWLSLQSAVMGTSERDNCVAGEPFTQTAQVTLDNSASEVIRFQMRVPDLTHPGEVPVLYCNAFEQCASEGDPLGSDTIVQRISVVTEDDNEANDNVAPANTDYPCTINMNCPNYLFGNIVCEKGFCIDYEDITPVCGDDRCTQGETKLNCQLDCAKASDFHLMEWITDHKILVTLFAVVFVFIGMFGVYGGRNE